MIEQKTKAMTGGLRGTPCPAIPEYMDLDMRKPVFRVCEKQRRRPACTLAQSDQCFVIHILESIIYKLATSKVSNF